MTRFRLLPRALLIAVLVPIAGAVFGMAGFRWEQVRADWRPNVSRTTTGWRISQVYGLRPELPALAEGHVAWNAGPYTILMDQTTGRTKLIGSARDAQSTWSPSIDKRYVAWIETSGQDNQTLHGWVYDIQGHRRIRLKSVAGVAWGSPTLLGSTAYWSTDPQTQGRTPVIVGEDVVTGRLFTVGPGGGMGDAISAHGSLVCWVEGEATTQDPTTIVALDLVSRKRWSIPLFASATNTSLAGLGAGGGRVAWLLSSDDSQGTGEISVSDLASGTQTVVAGGPGIAQMAFDGTTVVWTAWTASGSTTIMGRRLDGTPAFKIAEGLESVQAVAVNGDTVAWLVDDSTGSGGKAWIETARLPQ